MTTMIIVRHGQSTGNVEGLYCGQLDFPLTQKGRAQAELAGAYLKETYQIDAIYASDLCRAMQTAEPTARAFGLEIIPDKDLRETCVGEWQGYDAEMILQTRAEEVKRWKTDWSYAPKGGETLQQLQDRVRHFLDRVLVEHRDETIAVFGHAGSIGSIMGQCIPDRETRREITKEQDLGNAAVTVLKFDGSEFVEVVVWNYKKYLEGLSTITSQGVV